MQGTLGRFMLRSPEVYAVRSDNRNHGVILGNPRMRFFWEIVVDAESVEQAVGIAHAFWRYVPIEFEARWSEGDWGVSISPGSLPAKGHELNYGFVYRGCAVILTVIAGGYLCTVLSPTGLEVTVNWKMDNHDLEAAIEQGRKIVETSFDDGVMK